jgi:hypothetical protein
VKQNYDSSRSHCLHVNSIVYMLASIIFFYNSLVSELIQHRDGWTVPLWVLCSVSVSENFGRGSLCSVFSSKQARSVTGLVYRYHQGNSQNQDYVVSMTVNAKFVLCASG